MQDHRIEHDGLVWQVVDLDKLVEAPWNYKGLEADRSRKLRNNLTRNGQMVNLVVREIDRNLFEVVDGNHRLPELKNSGRSRAVVCNLGEVSQPEAVRRAIEINETRFPTDDFALAARLAELYDEFGRDNLLDTLPFSGDDLDHFDALTVFEWEPPELKEKKQQSLAEIVITATVSTDNIDSVKARFTSVGCDLARDNAKQIGRALVKICVNTLDNL